MSAALLSRIVLVFVTLASGTWCPAAEHPAADAARGYLDQRAASPTFSAAVLVEHRGQVVLREARGYADRELDTPLRTDHIFRIASLTKPFTAMAVLKLRDSGHIKLGDSICRYITACPTDWRQVTVEHLLHHTSGLPDLFGELQSVPVEGTRAEYDRVVESDVATTLVSQPGVKYEYNNFNYVTLGYIIESLSGRRWEQFLSDEVFAPAGLTDTGYDDVWAIVPKRAHGYLIKDGAPRNPPYVDHAAYAAGGLRSTLDDLRRWHDAFRSGRIVSRDTVAQAITPGLGGYGYGWAITRQLGRTVLDHTGGMGGFASHIAFFPDEELLIIVLANVQGADTTATACDLAALVLGDSPMPTGDPMWLAQPTGTRCRSSE